MHFDKNGEEILDHERLFLNNLIEIIQRLDYAKKKHPKEEWQKMTLRDAFNVLREEVYEVELEVNKNCLKRVNDELLDVIAVAVRMLNKEYIDT